MITTMTAPNILYQVQLNQKGFKSSYFYANVLLVILQVAYS